MLQYLLDVHIIITRRATKSWLIRQRNSPPNFFVLTYRRVTLKWLPAAIFLYRHASSLRIHAFTVTCLLTNFNVKIRSRHIDRQCIQLTHSFTYSNLSFTYWLIVVNIPNIRLRHTYKTYILIHSLLTQLLIRNTRSISHSKAAQIYIRDNKNNYVSNVFPVFFTSSTEKADRSWQ